MIVEVRSALSASRAERACGVPSRIQSCGIGAGCSSTSAGAAKTTGLVMTSPPVTEPRIKAAHYPRKGKSRGGMMSRSQGTRLGRRAKARRPIAPGAAERHRGITAFGLTGDQKRRPLLVDTERRHAPGILQAGFQRFLGERIHQL